MQCASVRGVVEPAPEEQEPTATECARLIHNLTDLSRTACADKPVYAVLCHATLRALAKHGFGDLGCRTALLIDESHKMKNCRVVYESLLSPSNRRHAHPPHDGHTAQELGRGQLGRDHCQGIGGRADCDEAGAGGRHI